MQSIGTVVGLKSLFLSESKSFYAVFGQAVHLDQVPNWVVLAAASGETFGPGFWVQSSRPKLSP